MPLGTITGPAYLLLITQGPGNPTGSPSLGRFDDNMGVEAYPLCGMTRRWFDLCHVNRVLFRLGDLLSH